MLPVSGFEIGVSASFFGSFCSTLGSQLRISALGCEGRASICLQVWGWATWLFGQGLGQVAILCAPATVAACVTFSSSLLCNALLAPLVLDEKLTLLHGLGISMLSVGGMAVTWAAAQEDHAFNTWQSLRELLDRRESAFAVGLCYFIAVLLCIHGIRRRALDMVSFAYLFALCGSTDLLVTKFTLQLCRLQVVATDRSELPEGLVTSSLVAAMMGMHLATFAFQVASVYYRKALQSLPLFLGSGAIMQMSLSGIFFREFDFDDRRQAFVFASGVVLVLGGLVVTSKAAPPHVEEAEEEEVIQDVPDGLIECLSEAFAGEGTPPSAAKLRSGVSESVDSTEKAEGRALVFDPFADLPLAGKILPSCGKVSRSSSFSSADLLLVGELQRGAVCFGGGLPHVPSNSKFLTWEPARRSRVVRRSLSSPSSSPSLGRADSNGLVLLPPPRASSLQDPLLWLKDETV